MQQVYRAPNMHVKRKRPMRFPLLPRYLFVGFVGAPVWDALFGLNLWLGHNVISGVIGLAGHPWRMDGAKVARWLRDNGMVRAEDAEQHMRSHKEFRVGDTVEIVEGAFIGQHAKVVDMSGSHARILIPLFGTEHEASAPLANLEKSA